MWVEYILLPDERIIKNKSYFFQNPNISSEDKNITQLKSPPNDIKVILNSLVDSHSAIP